MLCNINDQSTDTLGDEFPGHSLRGWKPKLRKSLRATYRLKRDGAVHNKKTYYQNLLFEYA